MLDRPSTKENATVAPVPPGDGTTNALRVVVCLLLSALLTASSC